MPNPLNNFDFSSGVDIIAQKVKGPFKRFFNEDQIKAELRNAHNRNDFKSGFVITPYSKDGSPISDSAIALLADAMPKTPFKFGGEQRIVKDFYPGSSEPTVQVLGPQESDLTITGRLKAKRVQPNSKEDVEVYRRYPQYIQESIEAIRVAGLLVRLDLGESWRRWGFIQEASFELKTLAEIDYSITFLIVGFNQPRDYIIVDKQSTIPYNKNKQLAASISSALNNVFGQAPASMPTSFAEQINNAISDVAAAANLVVNFVDTVLNEADSIKASVARAVGLVKNARALCSSYKRRVGVYDPQGGVSKTTRVNGAYANATYVAASYSYVNDINALLASLVKDLDKITATTPKGRHRVKSGDTLQNIAIKYFNDASKWESIYDHNKLVSTELDIGTILEIPRV